MNHNQNFGFKLYLFSIDLKSPLQDENLKQAFCGSFIANKLVINSSPRDIFSVKQRHRQREEMG
jgi:hypothetical protein